jgi:soluble lytic murein transglycosylase
MIMPVFSRPIVAVAWSLAVLALLSYGGSPDAAGAQPPSPTDQLNAARVLEGNGEWTAAEQAYQAVMQDTGEAGQSARLELARLLERFGRYDEAADLLQPLTELSQTNERVTRAWFQYGSVLQSMGKSSESVAAYRRYVQLHGPAAAYARIESAKMLIADGEGFAALAQLGPLLGSSGPEHARRVALRVGAAVVEDLSGPRAALEHYRSYALLATSAAERVPVLWKLGTLERSLGNTTQAAEAFRTLVLRYPYTKEAEDAIDALAQLGQPVSTLDAAYVSYRRSNSTTARRLYNQVLSENAPTADRHVALFYLGALAEQRGDYEAAIENYTEAYNIQPDGRLAADSLWWRGLALESIENVREAQASYERLATQYGSSTYASEAGFRSGFLSYSAGRKDEAKQRWTIAMRQSRPDGAARSAFWAAKTAAETGDMNASQAAYAEAAGRDPTGYYGLRAAVVLAGQPLAPRSGASTVRPSPPDWAAAEAWLAGWAGPEDAGAWQSLQAGEEWRGTVELVYAGWTRIAVDSFSTIIGRRADQPWLMYRIGRFLSEGALPNLGMLAGQNLVAKVPAGSFAPAAIQRLLYPMPWSDLTQRFADQYGVDPLLVYAMMRQESAFNPVAGSSAGAFGLTQVIPSTAEEIARNLGKRDFRFTDLSRPVVAIEFGAYYLGAMVKNQGGNVYRGLAAYNGGGGSANRWARAAGSATDVDRFYEEIDFSETKLYVRRVSENYAWYRFLYGGADRPSLLRP